MPKLPAKMFAITFEQPGDVDVIEKTEVPFPKQNPGDIIVQVKYGGVNFIDTYKRSGIYPMQMPGMLGQEASGYIVALPQDEASLNDEEFQKRNFVLEGKVAVYYDHSFAEYTAVPWKNVYPLPETVSLLTGGATILQGLTALTLLTEAYPVKEGDTILIHTIAGGFGLAATQIAKSKGAVVIGTTSTPEKAALAKAHGADHVIVYRTENTAERVLEITEGKGVVAVYDGVGKDTFDNNFKMLARKGTLISLGNASGVVPPVSIMKLIEKNIRLMRPTLANYVTLPEEGRTYSTELFELITKGLLKVNIFREYPFTDKGVKEAQLDLVGGKTIGKLMIKMDSFRD